MKNNQSFTVVEILSVVVIIGIISSFIIINTTNSRIQADIAKGKAFSLSVLNSLPANFVSEWKFDGPTTVDTVATTNDVKDTWGPNDGAVSGGLLVRGDNNCISGKCLDFDGADDFVTIADNDSLDLIGNYTISFWAYNGNGSKTYPTFFNRNTQSDSEGFFWCLTSGTNKVNIRYYWATGSALTSTTFTNVFDLNQWSYFVFTFVNSSKILKLYKNGTYTNDPKTLTTALPVNEGTFYVGTYGGSITDFPFQGKIDEFRIFNDVLPISQINQMYYSGLEKLLSKGEITKEEYSQRLGELNNNLIKQ